MSTRRRLLLALGLATLWPVARSYAQQGRLYRIGILSARSRSTPSNPEPYFGSFMQGMRELGYVEGKNLVVEWRYADGEHERLPALAAELVKLNPEVIVSHATQAVHALKRATHTIPIVMTSTGDPVGSGFAASFARPGGNITGLSLITTEVGPKHVALLRVILPSMSRIAVLTNPSNSFHPALLKSVEAAAKSAGVQVLSVQARSADDIERGFQAIARERVRAVIIGTDSDFTAHRGRIAEAAVRHRVATMNIAAENVRAGGLMSYGPDIADSYRRAAAYVDRILKGAKPGDLPIEQPTTFRLAINRKTAKAIGIAIPMDLLARANEVIE